MIIIEDNAILPSCPQPYGLTIGNFDGVHLGHQALIAKLRSSVGPHGTVAAFTFRNHPSALFHRPLPQITPLPQKLKLLETAGVDLLFLTDFSSTFANLPYDQFLLCLHKRFPFTFLILGQGATFGKERQGTPENLSPLAQAHHFHLEYLPKTPISSGKVRTLIQSGNLAELPTLLGRPYSLLLRFPEYSQDGYTIVAEKLCLPPPNSYSSQLLFPGGQTQAIVEITPANLMIHTHHSSLAHKDVEVVF